jgi:WhiB family redox-sensing transcriptional regulator
MDPMVNTVWMERARCQEIPPNTFFPSDGLGVEVAKAICAECAVSGNCLEYALSQRVDHGVWGGCSERQRRRIRRERRHIAVVAA